jgi:hypothetical protein
MAIAVMPTATMHTVQVLTLGLLLLLAVILSGRV